VRRDIEAAVVTAKALGFRSIVLQGHSLGTVQVAFYAATDGDRTIKGVIPHASAASRLLVGNRLLHDAPLFNEAGRTPC
jgi:pimeloyl-ACP methyl ester carboxylesterase